MKIISKLGLAILLLLAFAPGVNAQKKEKKIPFTVANRYFVSNEVKDGINVFPRITTREEYDKLFGMATVMGKNGAPTPIDFSKQYVIAVIDEITNKNVTLSAEKLTIRNNSITFTFRKEVSGETPHTYFRHCLIIIVDKKYEGEIVVRDTDETEYIPYHFGNRYFVNNTVEKGTFSHPKITTREEFDNLFGMAAVMGENGLPTPIDFSRQYVIALINESTEDPVEYTIKSLKKNDGTITLEYTKKGGETAGDGYRYCFILIVDKKYDSDVKISTGNN